MAVRWEGDIGWVKAPEGGREYRHTAAEQDPRLDYSLSFVGSVLLSFVSVFFSLVASNCAMSSNTFVVSLSAMASVICWQ